MSFGSIGSHHLFQPNGRRVRDGAEEQHGHLQTGLPGLHHQRLSVIHHPRLRGLQSVFLSIRGFKYFVLQ